jgi:hypothetical protein
MVSPIGIGGKLTMKAGMNQQPLVHQFRMRLFKPFWDE